MGLAGFAPGASVGAPPQSRAGSLLPVGRHERFQPDELLRQAVAAGRAGFDAVCCSDHLEPWWAPEAPTPAACGNAWVWLGAVGRSTRHVKLGTAVTGLIHRYNPVVVAQQVATLEQLFPGRAFLGAGSSEAMNEIPAGAEWPAPADQLKRTEEALTIITQLLDGHRVDFQGEFFSAKGARLYLKTQRRPPVYLSAFNEGAAEVAGRLADGVWTLGDPKKAAPVIAAYRRGAEEAGREPGESSSRPLPAGERATRRPSRAPASGRGHSSTSTTPIRSPTPGRSAARDRTSRTSSSRPWRSSPRTPILT